MAPSYTCERILSISLRVAAAVILLAAVAAVMPRAWMAAAHERLGLGAFPDAPIAEYLARTTSALYAMLGGLLWCLSANVAKYKPILRYVLVAWIAMSLAVPAAMLGWWGTPFYHMLLGDMATALAFNVAALALLAKVRKT